MRLSFIFIFAALMQVSASSRAQKITLSEKNTSLVQVLKKIKQQTGYYILYEDKVLKAASKINIQLKDVPLTDALDRILENQGLVYTIGDNTVVIKAKATSLLDRLSATVKAVFKSIDVKGRVIDNEGKPLPNASIRIRGKSAVTNTNQNGEFEIKDVNEDGVLLISYIGYRTLELSLKDVTMPLEIKLNAQTGELEEVSIVINTGYETKKINEITGSVVYIDNELFNRRVGATLLERLDDITSGLLNVGGYAPGSLENYRVRGISTINSSQNPLVVVDNFIFEGELNSINPDDIESVTILKDAAAASIWGVRAGNGVIVFTTKRGRYNQKTKISINSNITIGTKPDLEYIPSIPSKDIVNIERRRFESGYYDADLSNSRSFPVLSPVIETLAEKKAGTLSQIEAETELAYLENHDIKRDLAKAFLQNSLTKQNSINITGGGENFKYLGSIGLNQIQPNDINVDSKQLTLRINNTWKPLNNIEVSTEINWGNQKGNRKNSLSSYKDLLYNPYMPLMNDLGEAVPIPYKYRLNYVDTIKYKGLFDWHYFPVHEAGNNDRKTSNYFTRILTSIQYKIIQELRVEMNYQWQKSLSNTNIHQSSSTFATRDLINQFVGINPTTKVNIYPYPIGGILSRSSSDQNSWNLRGSLNYDKIFGRHNLSIFLGSEIREIEGESISLPRQYGYNANTLTFGAPQFGNWPLRPSGNTGTIGPEVANMGGKTNRFRSYFANGTYTFNERYTFSTSGRLDESNFFGVKANDRKVPLWQVSFLWKINEENITINGLSYLNLRISYGYNGNVNAGTSPFSTANYVDPTSPLFVKYAIISTPPNPQLRWEKVRNVNIGLDFGLKNQRITGGFEYYQKKGIDLLSQIAADPTNGFLFYDGNNASLKSKGIDFSLATKNTVGELKWNTNFLFSYNDEIVTSYLVPPPAPYLYPNKSQILIGKPLNNLFSYNWAGLDPLTGDARIVVNKQIVGSKDYDKVQLEDLVYNGRTTPSFFGSLRNNFTYKNASISIGVNYKFGYYFKRSSFDGAIGNGTSINSGSIDHIDYLNAWKMSGDELFTNVPGFQEVYTDSRYAVYGNSNVRIEKADHIRLQDIRIDYEFKVGSVKKFFNQFRIYAYMNNIGIIWRANKYKIDPEAIDFSSTPDPKTIALGLSLNF